MRTLTQPGIMNTAISSLTDTCHTLTGSTAIDMDSTRNLDTGETWLTVHAGNLHHTVPLKRSIVENVVTIWDHIEDLRSRGGLEPARWIPTGPDARELATRQVRSTLGWDMRVDDPVCPRTTPWGPTQSASILRNGILSVHTTGHGGYKITRAQLSQVDRRWAHHGTWFEEDCAWAIVAFHFPEVFSEQRLRYAHDSLQRWYPCEYAAITGATAQGAA